MNKRRKIEIPILPILLIIIFLFLLIRLCFGQTMAKEEIETEVIQEQAEIVQDNDDNETIPTTVNYIIEEQIVEEMEEEVIEEEEPEDVEIVESQVAQDQVIQTAGSEQVIVSPIYHKTSKGVVYYTIGEINIPKVSINYSINAYFN